MNGVHDRLRTALADRYTVEHEIGRGGMAYVFLANDLKHHRQVALKVLRPELAASVGADRFLREIEIEASLQHPHILPLYDSGEADGLLYYSMPFVEGETLRDKLRRETQLELDEALGLAREVAEAVAHAHSHGVVHRDIKPENILLSDGHAVVADFGVARAISAAGGQQLTDSGLAVGTPTYMSPEQALASADIDYRSDVYSLGLVLYEMLAGEPPFTGPTPVAVLARHANERVPSLEIVRPNVPSGVVTVIEKALEKVPADRYQTAAAFSKALDEGITIEAVRFRRPATSKPLRLAVVMGSATVVLVIGWWLFFGRAPAPDPDWVMVYPLEVSGEVGPADIGLGEDNAYLIWNALDGRGSLKWINAFDHVEDPAELAQLSARRRRSFARSRRAGFYLHGRTWLEGGNWRTYLTLHDVLNDSVVARADTVGSRNEARLLGVQAVGQLLLRFLPEETVDVSAIAGRNAEAVQAFVQAERHFHAGRFVRAFEQYSNAVGLDSNFALAAVKAAQAASWNHEFETAVDLIAVALVHAETLTPRHKHFARGVEAFLNASADSAVYHFERALDIDEDWTEAWTGLGEVYMHLLPSNSPQDSLARDAFERVYRNTAGSAPALYHLVEFAIRDGELRRASDLLEQYRAASPDTAGYAVSKLELMHRCAESGPQAIDWREQVRSDVSTVGQAARSLGVGGAYPDCALSAWNAIRELGQPNDPWQFTAWTGLQSSLVATGQTTELLALLDTTSEFGSITKQFSILDALAGADVEEMADSVAGVLRSELFDINEWRLWFLGTWDAHNNRVAEARAITDTLAARAALAGDRRTDLIARCLSAHVALADGDTTLAIQRLSALTPTAARVALARPWESLGLERLTLARVLLAQGRYADAARVAASFDSPGATNLINGVFLPASLEIRLDAARALNDEQAIESIERRLDALGR
jgi:tetratricopeptide (TPR) repeat protein